MPPRINSRFMSSRGYTDPTTGRFVLTPPEQFRYERGFDDDESVVVRTRDTTSHLAASRYVGFTQPMPAQLAWIINEYNAIFDPTLDLEENITLIVPSIRTVHEQALDPNRVPKEIL